MRLVKTFICDNCTPSDEEILKGLKIAKEKGCLVKLRWFIPHEGWHYLYIEEDMTFEECKEIYPTIMEFGI